jgi:sedoheptulose-bisphosphatase
MEGIYAHADMLKIYKAILDSTQEIGNFLRYHSATTLTSQNVFGKQQSDIDLKADDIIFKHLKKSGVVFSAASEEKPYANELNADGSYMVTFDPIDGSSVVDSNFSVASIFAVWEGTDINGLNGKDLVGAALAVYGSRTTIIIFNTQSNRVEELTLLKMGTKERWIVTTPEMKIGPKAKLFSPALKSAYDNPGYMELFEEYCLKGLSIRYSGAFAVDCYQMFVKGHGAYSMLDSVAHPSRLHLIYEIMPISFLIEKAGGKTSDGNKSVLDVEVKGYKQKINFIGGSSEDVEYIVDYLKKAAAAK